MLWQGVLRLHHSCQCCGRACDGCIMAVSAVQMRVLAVSVQCGAVEFYGYIMAASAVLEMC